MTYDRLVRPTVQCALNPDDKLEVAKQAAEEAAAAKEPARVRRRRWEKDAGAGGVGPWQGPAPGAALAGLQLAGRAVAIGVQFAAAAAARELAEALADEVISAALDESAPSQASASQSTPQM